MNDKRRASLRRAQKFLIWASDIVEDAQCEEEDCLSNMPENLEYSDRHEKMEEAIDKLGDVSELVGNAIDLLYDAMV